MRRLFILAVWLAMPGVCGAQVRFAPEGVQLSLSFAPIPEQVAVLAPVTLPSLMPSQLTPALLALTPVATPTRVLVATPAAIVKAFHTGDAATYLKAARAAEYQPPHGDEQQNALYQLGLEREAAERAVQGLGRVVTPVTPSARTTKIDYEEFGRQLARAPGLSLDLFRHAEAKRRILKAAGYTRLYGAGGVPVSIDGAADIRVGKAFANVFRAFERR